MKEYSRLKRLREERNVKIESMALMLDSSVDAVRAWESGELEMPAHKYIIIAKHYNLRLDYIVGLIDEPLKLEE